MNIEIENPQTTKEKVDAAWNHVEQARLALMVGDRTRLENAINESARLLSLVMDDLEDSP